jgi:hypothetical protein
VSSPLRRIRFALVVLIRQVLLIALASGWLVHMGIIAAKGGVSCIENNATVLWREIIVVVLLIEFGIDIFCLQGHRLNERRCDDRKPPCRG